MQCQINDQVLRLRGGGNRSSRHHKGRNRKNLQSERLEKLTEVVDIEIDILLELYERHPTASEPEVKETQSGIMSLDQPRKKEFILGKEFEEPEKSQDNEPSSDEEDEISNVEMRSLNIQDTENQTTDSKNLMISSFLSKERRPSEELIRNFKLYIIM